MEISVAVTETGVDFTLLFDMKTIHRTQSVMQHLELLTQKTFECE